MEQFVEPEMGQPEHSYQPIQFHAVLCCDGATTRDPLHVSDCRMVELDDESIRFHSI